MLEEREVLADWNKEEMWTRGGRIEVHTGINLESRNRYCRLGWFRCRQDFELGKCEEEDR